VTSKRVSLKVSPEAGLRVSFARQPAFRELVDVAPLVVLGNERVPALLSESIVPSASTCFGPRGACLTSADGPLWICDTGHHRLLGWSKLPSSDQAPADWLIGQRDFSCEGRNGKGEIGPNTVNVPTGICAVEGGLAVADAWNHRILVWRQIPRGSHVPADIVLGQADFTTGLANRGADHPRAETLHWPYGVYYNNSRLFVADTGNRRVLIWSKPLTENGQKADLVLGQNDFATRDENAGADPSAMSMRWPHAITFWNDRFCVSDAGNNRILVWGKCPEVSGASADGVIGQSDTTNVDFNQAFYWPRCNTLNMPYGITSSGDWLIVADTANSRLLAWRDRSLDPAEPVETGTEGDASALFGQKDFHEKGDNRWQPAAADSLCWPYGVQAVDSMIVMADSGNNRVSIWKLAL
jgi:hypothetical protein